MKRTISICLLLLCVLAASAQIQRKFLGFTLGVTTKTQVYNYLKKHHYRFSRNELQDGFRVENVTFGGIKWSVTFVYFHKNRFHHIWFCDTDDFKPLHILESTYEELSLSLDKKYYKYKSKTNSNSKTYSDGVTKCYLDYSFQDGMILSLTYSYLPLIKQEKIDNESEL